MKRYLLANREIDSRLASREGFSWTDGRILDPTGFLVPPSEFLRLKTLPKVAEEGNAILVAEGGMGKSFILEEFANGDPENVEKIALAVFEDDPPSLQTELEAKSSCRKYLLLDGLDEAPRLSRTLIRCLRQPGFPARVIIASRSILELKAVCETLQWPVYSLLPYTKDDVQSRCKEEKKDFDAFLRAVEGAGLGAVCAKPLGCNLLLGSFENGRLSATSSEDLWKRSLLRHCSENDKSKTRSLAKPGATPRECWNLACRAALALKLAGRSVLPRISAFPETGEIDVERLFSTEDRDKYNECLCRPLYVNIGQDKFRFAHSTYFDFMAAMGLVELVDQAGWAKFVLSPEGIPYPQWEGVIPWLAARDDALLEQVKKVRPDLLLASDAVVSKIGAEEICRCMLQNVESIPRTIRDNPAIQARYFALSTDGCVRQIADVLRNGRSETVVDTAIDIVQRARVPAMVDALAGFFCDGTKEMSLRVSAGYVLRELADESQRKKCRTALAPDLPNRMKGVLLHLLWPWHITAKELVPMLTGEMDGGLDAFSFWLADAFPATLSSLSESMVLELLEWAVGEIKKDEFSEHTLSDAKAAVFRHCWQMPFTERTLPLLAKGLESYAKIHHSPFEGPRFSSGRKNENEGYGVADYVADVEKRRRLAGFIAESGDFSLAEVTHWPIHLLRLDDIDFIVGELKTSEAAACRRNWAECLSWLQGGIELPARAELWNGLHAEFPDLFDGDAKSTLRERRKFERRMNGWEEKRTKKAERRKREQAEIRARNAVWVHEHLLTRPDSDTFAKIMWVVRQAMPADTTGFGLDFRKSELWTSFSQKEIDVLVSAAYDYILAYNGPVSSENECHPALLQAFYLLTAYDRPRLRSLPPAAWKRYSPELLRGLDCNHVDLVPLTLKCFEEFQPDVFGEELFRCLKMRLAQDRFLGLSMFKDVLNDENIGRLLSSLDEPGLSDAGKLVLYCEFWNFAPELTAKHIKHGALSGIPLNECDASISVFILASEPHRRIPELLRLLSRKSKWGRAWVEHVFGDDGQIQGMAVRLLKALSVDELKQLYACHLRLFPPEKAPEHDGVFTPTVLDNIYQFGSHIFNELISRLDGNLPRALRELQKRFPRLWYLREHELLAKRNLLERNCPTYDMDTILKIFERGTNAGIVHTGDDLLELVLVALEKYQVHLNGEENPRGGDLWNENDPVSPKDEGCLCDHLKDFLDRELARVVIDREVQLRRKTSRTRGARTDLWITAFSKKDDTRVTLCIEVKGDWNPELKTAFRNQLCARYMGKGGADAGIFLLGWFGAGKAAKGRKSIIGKTAAVKLLEQQQAELVGEKYLVRSVVLDCTY